MQLLKKCRDTRRQHSRPVLFEKLLFLLLTGSQVTALWVFAEDFLRFAPAE